MDLKRFKPYLDWSDDLKTRQDALGAFASFSETPVQNNCFVWGDGLYLILHFDLITTSPNGPLVRTEAYETVKQTILDNGGTRLGGSVYAIPLRSGINSENCAVEFWNVLCDNLNTIDLDDPALGTFLFQGDFFFLHYAPAATNLIGGISIIVGSDRTLPHAKSSLA